MASNFVDDIEDASASFFCNWRHWHALSCVFTVININDSFLMMRPSLM